MLILIVVAVALCFLFARPKRKEPDFDCNAIADVNAGEWAKHKRR